MLLNAKKREINMTEGPLLGNIIRYTIPIILTGVLQLMFNATDMAVIGNFRGSDSVGAVGSTGNLNTFIVCLLLGLATGVGVCAAQALGAKDYEGASKVLHTAIPVAVIGGAIIATVGFILADPLLRMMNTPESILPKAVLYIRIIFCGTVFNITNNFLSAILRASGDTVRPLIYLVIGGSTNVVLNVIFVTLFNMDVEGVAIATVVSYLISCVLVINRLAHINEEWKLKFSKIKVDFKTLGKIVRLGLPSGINTALFSMSNVIIQSAINSFGAAAVSGNAAAASIDGFIYIVFNAFYQTSLNFTGQNVGAGKIDRIGKITRINILCVFVVSLIMSGCIYLFSTQLLSIYIPGNVDAIKVGVIRLTWIGLPYFLCGFGEILGGTLRGMGKSLAPMIISIISVCGVRIVWIYTIFAMPQFHTMQVLYLSYPITWIVSVTCQYIYNTIVIKKHKKQIQLAS